MALTVIHRRKLHTPPEYDSSWWDDINACWSDNSDEATRREHWHPDTLKNLQDGNPGDSVKFVPIV